MEFTEKELIDVFNGIKEYLFNEKNYCLIDRKINERTLCGVIKEYLDFYFKNDNYFVDLEFNRNIPNKCLQDYDSKKKIEYNINRSELKHFILDVIEENNISIKNSEKLVDSLILYDNESAKLRTKAFIPDIIVHGRNNNNENNLFFIEVKTLFYRNKCEASKDMIKLALIKKFSSLRYRYYIYIEIDKRNVSFYYLNGKDDSFTFKKM